ncbi:MAG: polysaccharide deacetylase family protein [Gammaproteobacteria bacterium]|nr:polysaccharide deacetylase family protein [Gammaproteobacteria bacterium]
MNYLILTTLIVWILWFSERYAWWGSTVDLKRPRVLMYHMVSDPVPGAKFNGLRVSPDIFERQVRWLKDNDWRFVTMSELVRHKPSDKVVAITFDDGFEDNYLNAYAILKKYDAKATLYLVVDRHDRDWSVSKKSHHNSGELKNETKLSDQQIQEMLDSGIFELGGHTTTHANLLALDEDSKYKEIKGSKDALESLFETKLSSFAYPFGIYDPIVDPLLVQRAGFDSAVTTEDGIMGDIATSPFELQRIKISGKDGFLAFKIRMRRGKRGLRK